LSSSTPDILVRHEAILADWGEIVPASYVADAHTSEELEQIVRRADGTAVLPTVRIKDVVPTRRWCIDHQGKMMTQSVYHEGMQKLYIENFTMRGLKVHGKPQNEPVRDVELYVSEAEVDPMDPASLRPRLRGDSEIPTDAPAQLYNPATDMLEDRDAVLDAAYDDPKTRGRMNAAERIEVERRRGIGPEAPAAPKSPTLSALDALRDQLNLGQITVAEFSAQVARLVPETDASATTEKAPPKAPAKPVVLYTAACGKDGLKGKNGLRLHEARCLECGKLREAKSSGDDG